MAATKAKNTSPLVEEDGSGGHTPYVLLGAGGSGGAVTVADGADVTQGAKADAAVSNPASSGSLVALLKGILTLLGGVVLAAGSAIVGSVRDAGPHWTSVFGVSGATFTSADASGADAAVTDAPTSGQKLVITDVEISVDTAMRVDLKCETTAVVIASVYLPANGTAILCTRGKRKLATADKKLMVRTSASGNIRVTANYWSEA